MFLSNPNTLPRGVCGDRECHGNSCVETKGGENNNNCRYKYRVQFSEVRTVSSRDEHNIIQIIVL